MFLMLLYIGPHPLLHEEIYGIGGAFDLMVENSNSLESASPPHSKDGQPPWHLHQPQQLNSQASKYLLPTALNGATTTLVGDSTLKSSCEFTAEVGLAMKECTSEEVLQSFSYAMPVTRLPKKTAARVLSRMISCLDVKNDTALIFSQEQSDRSILAMKMYPKT